MILRSTRACGVFALAGLALTSGCAEPFSNEDLVFLKSLPGRDVRFDVPGQTAVEGGLSSAQATPGECIEAEFHTQSLHISRSFNKAIEDVVEFLEDVTLEPPTEREESSRRWGPFIENDAELVLVVRKTETSSAVRTVSTATTVMVDAISFWELRGRPKDADSDFFLLASGAFAPIEGIDHGMGAFSVSWPVVTSLFDGGGEELVRAGNMGVGYQNGLDGDLKVQLVLDIPTAEDFDEDGPDPDAVYHFDRDASDNVRFDFGAIFDFDEGKDPDRLERELFFIRARWLADNQGRADVAAGGGDLRFGVEVDECWDQRFCRTYFAANAPEIPGQIGSNLDCAPELGQPIE